MKTKFRTRFSLLTSRKDSNTGEQQLYLVSTINKNEVFYYSDHRVHPKNFQKKKFDLKGGVSYLYFIAQNTYNKAGTPASLINRRMEQLKNAANSVYEKYYKDREEIFTKEQFIKYLKEELGEVEELPTIKEIKKEKKEIITYDIFEYYDKYIEDRKVSDGRKRHYRCDAKRLLQYSLTLDKKLTFENLDIYNYTDWLLNTDIPKKVIPQKRSMNTVVSIMKRLRAYLNYCKKKFKIIKSSPFDEITFSEDIGKEQYGEPVIPTRDEVNKLYNYKFTNPKDILVKDLYTLQCCFGCRVGDYMRMNYDNISGGVLTYYAYKTIGEDVNIEKISVPLSQRAKEILNKYKDKTNNGSIMPFINLKDYNTILKKISREAGLNRKVIVFNTNTRKEETKILHEVMTSHIARKYFVDNLCQSGVPENIVASMSGHKEGSQAFTRYRRKREKLKKEFVDKYMD